MNALKSIFPSYTDIHTMLCLALLILALVLIIVRPIINGIIGEMAVALVLKFLSKRDYKILNNVKLYCDGHKSQIDHIIISQYGIFVLETKNYKGWILGSEYSYYWTQVIYKKKKRLYNPIRQNHGHVKALKHHLSAYPHIKYIPIVVFTWKSTLKVRTSSEVVKIFSLIRTIKRHKQIVLSEFLKNEIFEIIKSKNGRKSEQSIHKPTERTSKRYVEKCPSCSGALALKNGKYGQFKGCSNFPQCRYSKPI